jgi:hypothetical protein
VLSCYLVMLFTNTVCLLNNISIDILVVCTAKFLKAVHSLRKILKKELFI